MLAPQPRRSRVAGGDETPTIAAVARRMGVSVAARRCLRPRSRLTPRHASGTLTSGSICEEGATDARGYGFKPVELDGRALLTE